MGLFQTIKKALFPTMQSEDKRDAGSKSPKTHNKITLTKKSSEYLHVVKSLNFKKQVSLKLKTHSATSWNTFFSVDKDNPTLLGFDKRSRKKFKHLFHDENILIAEAAGVVELVTKEEIKQIYLRDTLIEKMTHMETNHKASIFAKNDQLALVNHKTNQAMLFEFAWKPFRFALGNDFWLVGIRKEYEGPGELYCFDYEGELKWAIGFREKMNSVFGESLFLPYHLHVSTDSTDIFVASMDKLYRLDDQGNLKARISIDELKESEMQKKQEEFQRGLSKQPMNEKEAIQMEAERLAYGFSMGFERMTLSSPFAGFAHDPLTDTMFFLEDQGRVTAWDEAGTMIWMNTFKNEGRYIAWIDNNLVISFKTGETFWMTRDGEFNYGAKLPKQAATIALIPNQEKFLVVCEDNRLYELHKNTGELVTGSEGHPGMTLFKVSERNIFFDGGKTTQGYFWMAPELHEWKHFEAKTIATHGEESDVEVAVATEIDAIKDFSKRWKVESEAGWFGSRVIEFQHKRIYAVVKAERVPIEQLSSMTRRQREKDETKHYLVCMDFKSNVLWKKLIYSSMWSLFVSPDGEYVFTSVPSGTEITYLPGYLLVLTKDGEDAGKLKVPAHGFQMSFTSNETATIRLASEKGEKPVKGLLRLKPNKKWEFIQVEGEALEAEFGAGLYVVETDTYTLTRTDKKKYMLQTKDKELELKLSAAIYEAYETNEKLVFRTGTRFIAFYNKQLEKEMEIKETDAITSVILGGSGFVVVTKKEVKGYDIEGKVIWRYSPLPKTYESIVEWVPSKELYVWVVSNNQESIVATITEDGKVIHSQSFDKSQHHRVPIVSREQECFVIQSNAWIQAYGLTSK